MAKYLAGVLTAIAVGVLLIAYGLLAPQASATFNGVDRFGVAQAVPQGYAVPVNGVPQGYGMPMNSVPQGYGAPGYGVVYPYQMVAPASAAAPYAVPINYVPQQTLARPAVYENAPVQRLTSSSAQSARTTVQRAPRRDWKKTALVIGGSSAAGAGVGGLIGGKKGALIGAALGGGASTLWETTRK